VNNVAARYTQYRNPSISAGAAKVMKPRIANAQRRNLSIW
jgi:hypothetical protein